MLEVFISYSHKDQKLRRELDKHLSNLKRQQIISSWFDGDIVPGTEWQPQILHHLNTAQIILLLISADFMASDFCSSIEMVHAIARHEAKQACVIPILLRSVDWSGAPFAKLQMLPLGARPVTEWTHLDRAFTNIAQGIKRAIDELTISATSMTGSPSHPTIMPPESVSMTVEPAQGQRLASQLPFSGAQPGWLDIEEKLNRLLSQAVALNSRLEDLKNRRDEGFIDEARYMALAAGREQQRIEILLKVRKELEGRDKDFDALIRDAIAGEQERLLMDRLAQLSQQRGLSRSLIESLNRHQGPLLFWLIEVSKHLIKMVD